MQQLAWEVLGVRRDARLDSHGTCQAAAHPATAASTTVSMIGSIRIGGQTRRVVLPLHMTRSHPRRVWLVGHGAIPPSDYDLRGRRGTTPFAAEQAVVLVWSLVFETALR